MTNIYNKFNFLNIVIIFIVLWFDCPVTGAALPARSQNMIQFRKSKRQKQKKL